MTMVPPIVGNMARAVGADRWLASLPDVVDDLAGRWGLTVGEPYVDATEAFVVRVTRADGTPAVLKLVVPRARDAAAHEITVLRLAGGDGCVRLLDSEPTRGALLLERLGRSLYELRRPIGERHEILCAAAEALWRPAPEADLMSGAEKGRWLIEHIRWLWSELDRPCSERAVDHAVACAERRIAGHDDERAVLVHGDVHRWNALQGGDGFKLVDPDGLLADAEYDLGIVMREDPDELLTGDPHDRSRWLARRCGRDEQLIWEWGVVERVSTGLLGLRDGLDDIARVMLAVADRVAAAEHNPAG